MLILFVNIIAGSWAIHGQQGVEAIRTFHTLSTFNWGAVHSVPHIHKWNAHSAHTQYTQKCTQCARHRSAIAQLHIRSWSVGWIRGRDMYHHEQICKRHFQSIFKSAHSIHSTQEDGWTVDHGQLLLSGHSINSCQGILDNSLTTGHLKDWERPATMRCFFMFSYKINLHFQFVHGQRLFWQASIFGSVLGEWYRSRCIGQLQTWGGLGLYGSYGCKLGLYCAVAEKWKQLSNIQHISSHWSYNRNPFVSCKAYHHITRGT